jgi:acetyl-CoA synthetase
VKKAATRCKTELIQQVRRQIVRARAPESIQFAPGTSQDAIGQDHASYPAQACRRRGWGFGDITTLADPSVVAALVEARGAK